MAKVHTGIQQEKCKFPVPVLFLADTWLKGLFRGQLIIETYALVHLPAVESLPLDLRYLLAEQTDTHPTGALATATLAVCPSIATLHAY